MIGSPLNTLRRVLARPPRELAVRGVQQLRLAAERVVAERAAGRAHPYDGVLSGWRGPTDRSPLEHFRERTAPSFFPSFRSRAETVAALRRRWPAEQHAIVAAADAVLAGRFDLLGHRGVDYGTPPDWHADALRGVRAPVCHWSRIAFLDPDVAGDHKLVWELNRHHHLVTLGQAYWYTEDERYAVGFVEHVSSWLDANPPRIGINWASSLEVAFRSIAWIWALHYFRHSPSLDEALFRRMLGALAQHGRHIETNLSTYFSPNTHLTGEALGLVYLGTMLPELRAAKRWRRRGLAILRAEMQRQVLPDGVYFELTSWYHRYTLDFLLHLHILLGENGVEPGDEVTSRLPAMFEHLAAITRPDGTVPLTGDDDGGRLLPLGGVPDPDFRATLACGAALLRRGDLAHVAGAAPAELIWLLGAEGLAAYDALDARPPASMSAAFGSAGIFVLRDGWDRQSRFLMIDAGPHGALSCGHAHADALAIVASCGESNVLVDAGTFTYTVDAAARDRYRGTGAHNTVIVDGVDSSVPAGPFRWARSANTTVQRWLSGPRFDYIEAAHDGYARLDPPAMHARSVFSLRDGYWVIRDRLDGGRPRSFESRYHHGPELTASADPDGRPRVWLFSPHGADVAQLAFAGRAVHVRVERCMVSCAYGTETEAMRTIAAAAADGGDLLTFVLPAAVACLRVQELPARRGTAAVAHFDTFDDWILSGGRNGVRVEDVDAVCSFAWVRRAKDTGAVLDFIAVACRSLRIGDRTLVDAPTAAESIRMHDVASTRASAREE